MTLLAAIGITELAAARCDRCHERAGLGFVDGFWACVECALAYLEDLEAERRPPMPLWLESDGRWWRRR